MSATGGSMDDDRFDGLLREAAQGYNAPPPTPADAPGVTNGAPPG